VVLPLNAHSTNLAQQKAGVRVIAALCLAACQLSTHYPQLINNKMRQATFPFPHEFQVNGLTATLHYEESLSGQHVFHRNWTAGPGRMREACYVKFALCHNHDLYTWAAAHGWVPWLFHVECMHNWFVIITENMSGYYTTLATLKEIELYSKDKEQIKHDQTRTKRGVTAACSWVSPQRRCHPPKVFGEI
ncbi:hypothetical protein K438DRAFT_1637557, partial [Mycena galopus ATCC 62051]